VVGSQDRTGHGEVVNQAEREREINAAAENSWYTGEFCTERLGRPTLHTGAAACPRIATWAAHSITTHVLLSHRRTLQLLSLQLQSQVSTKIHNWPAAHQSTRLFDSCGYVKMSLAEHCVGLVYVTMLHFLIYW